ncbi:sensor histidine kinase [Nocardioides sp.]|uniref:sensor histidine kinase n=1 Tax=Nocardioides sp. TaxID=35761 RepID=UPI0025F67DE4|nr:sensor histidine kinase [Nocardioides sp.]
MTTSRHPQPPVRADHAGPARLASTTVSAMRFGQDLIALVLVVTGTARALAAGTSVAAAVTAGVALLGAYAAGLVLARAPHGPAAVRWWLLVLTLVWAAAVAVSPEFVWFAFALWLLAGHLLPGPASVAFAVAVYAIAALAPIAHHGTTGYANVLGPLIGGVFALGVSRGYLELLREAAEREKLVSSLAQAQREMADLQDELALTQRASGAMSERTRLARDIHDTVAQSLSSIRLLSHAAGARVQDAEAARAIRQVETLAGEGLSDVRRIVAALAPVELESDPLADALARMLERLRGETGVETELHVDATLPALPTAYEVALMRTAQSALANVRLHAHASRVVLSLIDEGDAVRLDIVDDGRGFDATAWESAPVRAGESGYGLRFIRSRLRELGGGLDVEAVPGEGTALSAHLVLTLLVKET